MGAGTRIAAVVLGAAPLLAAFGFYESVDASMAIFLPPRDTPLAELFRYPLWSLTHFVPGALFMALAPLLRGSFRNQHRTVHRRSGRLVAACAVFLGVSGIAFPFTMPSRPIAEQVFMTSGNF